MWLFPPCFVLTLDVDCTARLNITWWCVITRSQIAIMMFYGWYHKVRHESVKKINTLLGNTQFPDTVLYNKLLAMFVLLKLTWYDSILLKLRREKLKKKYFTGWQESIFYMAPTAQDMRLREFFGIISVKFPWFFTSFLYEFQFEELNADPGYATCTFHFNKVSYRKQIARQHWLSTV